MRPWLSVAIGLVLGVVLFEVVEPMLLGARPAPILDREANIFFLFRLFPLFVVPSVCLLGLLFGGDTRRQICMTSFGSATAMLLPIPVASEWLIIPKQYGLGTFSAEVLIQIFWAFVYLLVLSLLATLASVIIVGLVHRRSRLS